MDNQELNSKGFGSFSEFVEDKKTKREDEKKPTFSVWDKELHAEYKRETGFSATYGKKDDPSVTTKFKKWFNNKCNPDISPDISVKELCDEISDDIIEEFDIKTIRNKDGDSSNIVYIRDGISYEKNKEPIINAIREKTRDTTKSTYLTLKNNILGSIKDSTMFDPLDFFTDDPYLIPFINGVYNGKSDIFTSLEDLDAYDYKFFYKIPYEISNERYRCPKFKNVLREWLTYIDPKTNKVVNFPKLRPRDIFEMIGLTLTMNTSFKKEIILLGVPDTAKTQFLNVLMSLIPLEFRSATPLHRIGKNEFGLNDLPFKIANICDDLPDNVIKGSGTFKNITGGTKIAQAEGKGKDSYNFKPYAKHWFATNKLGELKDPNDMGLFRRFFIIHCAHIYKEHGSNTITDYYKTFTEDKTEFQGILQECLKGYHRLITRGHFRKELVNDTQHIWNLSSDPVYRFLQNKCERGNNKDRIDWNYFQEIFATYTLEPYTSNELIKRLTKYGYVKKKGWKEGKTPYFLYGIKWQKWFSDKLTKGDDPYDNITEEKVEDDNSEVDETKLFYEKEIPTLDKFDKKHTEEAKTNFLTEIENEIKEEMKKRGEL